MNKMRILLDRNYYKTQTEILELKNVTIGLKKSLQYM